MNKEEKIKLQENNQFMTFGVSMHLVDLIIWSYYYILLYKTFNSLTELFVDYLLLLIGLWVGFILGSFYIHKIGILNTFRVSFSLLGISSLLILIFMDDLSIAFIPLAFIRGVSRGFFWPPYNVFQLREMDSARRGYVINSMVSLQLLLNVAVPILSGAIIEYSDSYNYVFAIGVIIYFITSIIPWDYNKIPRNIITLSEVIKITKNKNFSSYSYIIIFESALNAVYTLMFLIIPFLFLNNEFSVGLLASAVGLISAWV